VDEAVDEAVTLNRNDGRVCCWARQTPRRSSSCSSRRRMALVVDEAKESEGGVEGCV
jgi:hypothetical protein